MSTRKIISYGLLHALGAAVYVVLVALLLANAEGFFGQGGGPLMIAVFLLLLVISVSVMGTVIFARPAMWYLDGKKQEAVRLVLWTVGFLLVAAAILFFALAAGSVRM